MKNTVYVENQPKKSLMSIIIINKSIISQEEHDSISKLGEISDLFFIFGKNSKGINPEKFTSLCEGCAWIKENNLVSGFLTAHAYSSNIFQCHLGYLLSDINDLKRNINTNEILRIHALGNTLPIVRIERKTVEELREIYEEKKSLWKRDTKIGKYSTYKTDSWTIFFRKLPESCLDKEWVSTFSPEDPKSFYINSLRRSGIGNINETCDESKTKGEE